MATKSSSNLAVLSRFQFDFKSQFRNAVLQSKPWDSIVDFAEHKSFGNFRTLFPKQKTLLKLIYLETEHFTAFDIDTIDKWAQGFTGGKDSYGVQKDIWERIAWLKERGYRRFPHVQAVLGRRASKGLTGGILGAESIAHMISLDNPQNYYGIAENKEIQLSVIATMLDQAKTAQFNDIRNAVTNNNYLKPYIANNSENSLNLVTPADVRLIREMHATGQSLNKEISTIKCQPFSSNSSGSRGGAGFALFLDEFAHMLETEGSRSGKAVYDAATPSLDQFKKDQLIYCASSPYTKVGKFFELYTQGSIYMDSFLKKHPIYGSSDRDEVLDSIEAKADPTKLVIQLASWQLYEGWELSGTKAVPGPKFKEPVIAYDDALKVKEQQDPQAFKVERRGQFAEVIDGYLDSTKVDEIFLPYKGKDLKPIDYGLMTIDYHSHLDPGRANANFAMCIAHSEQSEKKDDMGEFMPHVVIDYLHVWNPADFPNNTINYEVVKADILQITNKFQSLRTMTFDQWQSGFYVDYFDRKLKRTNVSEETATEAVNQQRYDWFKVAVNQGMIHSYKDTYYKKQGSNGESLLELELKFLQEKNRKVVKQDVGPVTTKDLSDCVVIVTARLLGDYFNEYARKRLGETKLVATNLGQTYDAVSGRSIGIDEDDPRQRMKMASRRVNSGYNPAGGGRFAGRR